MDEAARVQLGKDSIRAYGATFDDVKSEVIDHYRLFSGLEEMFKTPPQLNHQSIYQLDAETMDMLIQRYLLRFNEL